MVSPMKIYFGKRRIRVDVRKTGFFGRARGLMFRTRNAENLLFDFGGGARRAIHSFFVFFPFLAVWLDGKNKVIEFRVVTPFKLRVVPSWKFRKLVEIPVSGRNREIISFFRRARRGVDGERFK